MIDIPSLSKRLRDVLSDLERVTDDLETIQVQGEKIANDDFLTRTTGQPKGDL